MTGLCRTRIHLSHSVSNWTKPQLRSQLESTLINQKNWILRNHEFFTRILPLILHKWKRWRYLILKSPQQLVIPMLKISLVASRARLALLAMPVDDTLSHPSSSENLISALLNSKWEEENELFSFPLLLLHCKTPEKEKKTGWITI